MHTIEKLHDPPSKSGTLAYTSLCTVVQAFPLAVIFWAIGQDDIYEKTTKAISSGTWLGIPFIFIVKALIVIALVAVVWHRYVLDSNFMAWRLNARDTLIPFGFAFVQCFLAMAIRGDNLDVFSFMFTLVTVSGIGSYSHAVAQFKKPHALALFKAHYGDALGTEIYGRILKYYTFSRDVLVLCSIVNVLVFIVCSSGMLSSHLALFLVSVVFGANIVYHFVDNSTRRLEDIYSGNLEQFDETHSLSTTSRPRKKSPNSTHKTISAIESNQLLSDLTSAPDAGDRAADEPLNNDSEPTPK